MRVIEVTDLTRNYNGLCAVDQISFHVFAGEVFGFLGPNGAGKSTTIRMLTGQLRPTSGTAKVAGFDIVTERDQLKPRIGVVFEHQNLYERSTGWENIRLFARLYGVSRAEAHAILGTVGLADRANDRVKNYSNGMKQRLLIARALLHRPQILFLDEPTRGLDPHAAREIRAIVRDLADGGTTVFLTTHYMEEADQLSDRVAIIDHGRIVSVDTPGAIKDSVSSDNGKATLEDAFIQLTGRPFGQGEVL